MKQLQRIFVIENGDQPIVAFLGQSINEGRELCRETWFLDDLQKLRSGGAHIWDGRQRLKVRHAHADELAGLQSALHAQVKSRAAADDVVLSYLVPLDEG
jgi:hypothetical protein